MTKPNTIQLSFENTPYTVEVVPQEQGFQVLGECIAAEVGTNGQGGWSVLTKNQSVEAQVTRHGDELLVELDGERFIFSLDVGGNTALAGKTRKIRAEIKSPMPGRIAKLLAREGDNIKAGQGVLLFEAMKMQNELRSPHDGILSSIAVQEGDTVEAKAVLFVVDPT